jgi:hypothetical protein
MSVSRRSECCSFFVRTKGIRLFAAGLLTVAIVGEARAKNELVTGTGFNTWLTDAPVMNNDGQVAYIKHSSIVLIGGIGASFINLDDITNNTFVRIATEGEDVPGGVGQSESFSLDGQNSVGLRVNDIGQGNAAAVVMFHAFLDGIGVSSSNNQAIYTGYGTFQGEVARKGDAYNQNGDEYVSFFAMGIDRIGEAAYLASVDPDGLAGIEDAIFRKQGTVLQVVDAGDTIPGGGGQFSNIGFFQGTNQIVVNNKTSQLNSEKIAFHSFLSGTSSGANDFGVYRASQSNQIVQMARGDQTLIGGKISVLGHPDINNNGWVAYNAALFGGSSDEGIFAADDSGSSVATLAVALEGNLTPDGFTFTGFGNEPDVNNLNWVAFLGTFNGPSNHNNGLYRASTGPSLTTITEEGDFPDIPGLNNLAFVGTFGDFTLNDNNQVAFIADIEDGFGGSVEGIYVGLEAGKSPQEVARVGQTLDGKTIANLKVNLGVDVGGSTGFNNEAQVAYLAEFSNGSEGIYRFTPTLKIAVMSADTLIATWDIPNDWNLGVVPPASDIQPLDPLHDVAVGDGAEVVLGGTVEGPTSSTWIGDLDVGYPTIPSHPNPTVEFLIRETSGDTGAIGPLADHREAPLLTVDGTAEILSTGQLTVEGDDGLTLLPVLEVVGDLSNLGRIQLMRGGKIGGHGTLVNVNTLLGDGVVCPNLENRRTGQVLVSNGENLMFMHTDMANTNEGTIVVESEGALMFAGDLVNLPNGEVALANDARMTVRNLSNDGGISGQGSLNVLGDLSGTGLFGEGSVDVGGLLMPANGQVGEMTFGGDLSFGPEAGMDIDIRRGVAGNDYDQVKVADVASLAGILDISIKPSSLATAGDKYEILTAASVLGNFDTVVGPPLPDDLLWFVNYGAMSVELVSTFGADFDEDGDVDDVDLAAWEGGFGSEPAVHMDGDANADALANGFDFLAWQRQVGDGGAAVSAAATIPEPATVVLLVGLATVGLLTRRGRCVI